MTKKDIAWKYATEEAPPSSEGKKGYKYLKCKFCSKVITGGVKRVKEHLACTHKNVAPCPKVTNEVKEEVKLFMTTFTKTKHMAQQNFEEMVDSGASYGLDESGEPSVRGPMDRFIVSPGEEIPPANPKEHREVVCYAIGRFFIENGISFNVAKSPSFHAMLRSVGNYGRGLKIPTPYELSTKVLQRQVKDIEKTVEEIKATWPDTGVSILSDD